MAEGLSWGDILLVDLGGGAGRRPAVVLSRTGTLPYVSLVTVAPITQTRRGLPSEVALDGHHGLKGPSVVRLDQLQSVPPEQLGKFVGSVGPEHKVALRAALLFSLELSDADASD